MIFICCLFLQASALAHANISENISDQSAISGIYEQTGISEYNHLIELYFEENDYVFVTESIVYSTGSANDSEEFVLWVPENAEIMQFQVTDMASSSAATSVNYSKEGNFLYFPSYGTTSSSGMPLLYDIRYATHSHEAVPTFRKVIREDEVFDYPISRLIIVVNHEENEIPAIISAEGLTIAADEIISDKNYTSYIWSFPQFNELSIALEKNNDERAATIPYNSFVMLGILGIIIVIMAAAILHYRKESPGEMSKLEDRYEAELTVLAQIKADRKKNKLSKEEFESLHKKHSDNALKIKSKMEKLKKT